MHVLIVILIISFLIIIHELGHYLMARRIGVKIEEFGLGYPPKLLKLFTRKGTDFSLNLIPFGGFVRLEGENGPDRNQFNTSNLSVESVSLEPSNSVSPFYTKSPKQKMMVVLAGVATNLLFALFAFSVVYSVLGIPVPLHDQARIGLVADNSPAAQVNLPVNSNIVEMRTKETTHQISNFTQVQEIIAQNQGSYLTLLVTLECDGVVCPTQTQEFTVYVRTPEETPVGEGALGIAFQDVVINFYPWYEMPLRGTLFGFRQAVGFGYLILQALVNMFSQLAQTGSVSKEIAGPVGIVYEAQRGNIVTDNFWINLGFAGMLSLNLAVINLLPVPALDGGRALFIFLEKLFGQKKIQQVEIYANYAGFALLIVLIITITINDVSRIISG